MRLAILCASALLMAACGTTKYTGRSLQAELEAMLDTDQSHRMMMITIGKQHGSDSPEMTALWKKQQSIDVTNTARLVNIVERNGWPGIRLVGEKGARGAFLVLQHADYTLQKKYLPLFRAAVAAGEARPWNLALLEDRVLTREGKKQIYGSQWRKNGDGIWELYPIEDEPGVDKRRQALGMPLIAEDAKGYGVEYRPK